MARKHLIEYYIQTQNMYFEQKRYYDMIKADYDKDPESIPDDLLMRCNVLTEQYYNNWQNAAFFITLLNEPNRKDKREGESTKALFKLTPFKAKKALIDPNADALVDFKDMFLKYENSKKEKGDNKDEQ